MNSLADLGLRRARVAALIMWRAGLRVGETVALEWRDIDLTAGTLLVRRGKGGRGRTVPLHPDLARPVRQLARVLCLCGLESSQRNISSPKKEGHSCGAPLLGSWVFPHGAGGMGWVSRSGVRR